MLVGELLLSYHMKIVDQYAGQCSVCLDAQDAMSYMVYKLSNKLTC